MSGAQGSWPNRPDIVPLGDSALLVRFAQSLDDAANKTALSLAARLANDPITGVVEVVPALVSVLVRYNPTQIAPVRLAGELALRLGPANAVGAGRYDIDIHFDGPDMAEVAAMLSMSADDFIVHHNAMPLRVLTIGFAPGFIYCGFHPEALVLPRRPAVRPTVPAGSVLFAAGQTAIAATEVPTGWHVIGTTDFRNFSPDTDPPTRLRAGDVIHFGVA